MRKLIYLAALGLLALGGCSSQTASGYRPQSAALPGPGFMVDDDDVVVVPYAAYVPRSSNPAINSAAQERLYAHPE
jgi:hypothetical protein